MKISSELSNRLVIGFSLAIFYFVVLISFLEVLVFLLFIIGFAALYELFKVIGIKDKRFIILSLIVFWILLFDQTIFLSNDFSLARLIEINVVNPNIVLISLIGFVILPSFFPKLGIRETSCMFVSLALIVFAIRSFWWLIGFSVSIGSGWEFLALITGLAISADIGGYFVGKKWGKTPINIEVSKRKTWEGFVGGIFLSFFFLVSMLVVQPSLQKLPLNFFLFIVFVLIINFLAIAGDLFFSKIKRTFHVKDFSNLLQKQGGILDRFDSHIPVYIFIPIFLGVITSW